MRHRPLAAAFGLALLNTFAAASSVSAECHAPFDPREEPWIIGDAFLATVTEKSADVDVNADGSPYDWHVELRVDAIYRGSAPETLSFNGWDNSCGEFHGDGVSTGDRLIITMAALHPEYLPGAPFEGRVVVWHKIDGGWDFYDQAIYFGTNSDYYPPAARAANTKAEILQLIAGSALPSTATAGYPEVAGAASSALLPAVAAALSFVVAWRRFRPRLT
jgi:hypothetical protein